MKSSNDDFSMYLYLMWIWIGVIVILAMILFPGCQFDYRGEKYIDPVLMPYWITFQAEADRLGVNLPNKTIMMEVRDMGGANGYCWSSWDELYCKITISPNIPGGSLTPYNAVAEATIFHEFGHGLLNRHHLVRDPYKEYEKSLMSIPQGGRKGWKDGTMREYYLLELFEID